MLKLRERPRRNRQTEGIRKALQETDLLSRHLVLPAFVLPGNTPRQAISSMPGVFRENLEDLYQTCERAMDLGVSGLALFPVIDPALKNANGTDATNPDGLLPKVVTQLKKEFPDLTLFCDVALDPYTDHGHDGILKDGQILNDETIEVLKEQSLVLAMAGSDFVSPSDMMDGRIGAIRDRLDEQGLIKTGILSYAAKYASCQYSPFREALASAPKSGDKKTYQMDLRNRREAIREARLDVEEGADIIMVKPALSFLDIIADLRGEFDIPIAAYQVSGEYAMIKAAGEKGWIDSNRMMMEALISMRRAGADMIFTYAALEVAESLNHL